MTDKNKRGKCATKVGRPCKGKSSGKNARGGCKEPKGRPCGSKSKGKGKK
mgnify:FL=1